MSLGGISSARKSLIPTARNWARLGTAATDGSTGLAAESRLRKLLMTGSMGEDQAASFGYQASRAASWRSGSTWMR
jgi:hypothetical protein